jgi:hypothetical protein
MNAVEVGNVADLLQCVGIDNHDVSAASDKQSIRTLLVGKVIPPTVASELYGIDEFVLLLRERGQRQQKPGDE